jgi:hypothetical protein
MFSVTSVGCHWVSVNFPCSVTVPCWPSVLLLVGMQALEGGHSRLQRGSFFKIPQSSPDLVLLVASQQLSSVGWSWALSSLGTDLLHVILVVKIPSGGACAWHCGFGANGECKSENVFSCFLLLHSF